MKKPFLLKYTALNTEGEYRLVYAKTEKQAIKKLKKQLFYLSQLYIVSCTVI